MTLYFQISLILKTLFEERRYTLVLFDKEDDKGLLVPFYFI